MAEGDEIVLSALSDEQLVDQMHQDLYDGLREEIEEGVRILLDRGWTPYRVLTEALVEGMRIVGIDFRDGILFVPEVLLAANAMKGGMAILRPLLAATGAPPQGKMVIGTVKGDGYSDAEEEAQPAGGGLRQQAAGAGRQQGRDTAARVLIIACGALIREIDFLAKANRFNAVDVKAVPATYHNRPEKIAPAVARRIAAARGHYETIFVAYADCGTSGALDRVLAAEAVELLTGAHCYAFFSGLEG